jgi:ubiquinone/menaquinone biosynthesis C-methylase UbiE
LLSYYNRGLEHQRLLEGAGQVELARTQALIARFLPAPSAVIYDVGGGSGLYATWLARQGYAVHLVDAVPLHVQQARETSAAQPVYPLASIEVGDARHLDFPDASADAVLLLGPLYHLVERADRLQALRESARVLRPGGIVLAAVITRFASTLYGLLSGKLDESDFAAIARQDLEDGQHRNPTNHPAYFTTAFFHYPDELKQEIDDADLQHEATLAVEGPITLLPAEQLEQAWADPARRQRLLEVAQALEAEPSLLGVSPHLIGVGRRG